MSSKENMIVKHVFLQLYRHGTKTSLNVRKSLFVVWIGACLYINYLIGYEYFGLEVFERDDFNPAEYGLNTSISNLKLHKDSCDVLYVPPFHSDVLEFIRENKKPKPNCKPKDNLRSTLKDGVLKMDYLLDEEDCVYRLITLSPQGDVHKEDTWYKFGTEGVSPEGDFVQVWCSRGNETSYQFLHYQVYKKVGSNPPPKPSNSKPDVHILVIDSVSMSQVRRALPKTMKYISAEMGALFFPFHNKKASDTMGQSHVLLMGKVTQELTLRPGQTALPYLDIYDVAACGDNSTFLLKAFKENGYKVMMGEDWTTNKFMTCLDNETLPVDHYMSVYWLKLKRLFPNSHVSPHFGPAGRMLYHPNLWERFCIERHLQMFNYLEDFMEKYRDYPKFTVTWLGYLTHDYRGDLFQYDDDFVEFFKRMKNKVQDSHFFFLGDHGNRIYSDKTMFWDRIEDNNAAMFYIPPKAIKEDKMVMRRIRRNAQQLVSTMDIYATLVDIVTNAKDFTASTSPNMTLNVTGSSILRELPQPRNCDTLELSYEYCTCQTFGPRTQNHALSQDLAKTVLDYINNFIMKGNDSDICTTLSLAEGFAPLVEEYRPEEYKEKEEKVYIVTLKTYPGNALYMPHVRVQGNGTMEVVGFVGRKNAFGHQARCINERYGQIQLMDHFCFCKNLLNNEREVNKVNN